MAYSYECVKMFLHGHVSFGKSIKSFLDTMNTFSVSDIAHGSPIFGISNNFQTEINVFLLHLFCPAKIPNLFYLCAYYQNMILLIVSPQFKNTPTKCGEYLIIKTNSIHISTVLNLMLVENL